MLFARWLTREGQAAGGSELDAAASGSPDPLQLAFRGGLMHWSKWVRQIHRWLSIAFTVAVIVNIVALIQQKQAVWVALFPLAFLMLTGLHLFVLPHAAKWRGAPDG
jgi:hypothetical protein